jgi:DNA-binding IclR family transcriptional regulator
MPAIEILEALNKTPRLSPILVASKTGIAIQYVRNLLVVLLELKLVETPSRGLYQITDLGEYILKKRTERGYNG